MARRIARERPDAGDPAALVAAGRVRVGERPVTNPRALVPAHEPLAIDAPVELRGTRKLRAALARFFVPVAGRVCVDVGASTGGFTVALLAAGARRVYAVDAGHGQLLGRLRQDPRVVVHERTNLADIAAVLPEPIELGVVDLSYLALARAAPQLGRIPPAAGAELVALVKPMFELGLAYAPLDDASLAEAIARAAAGLGAAGFDVVETMESPVAGGGGAREGFIHATFSRVRR